jgi:hypothetical protein
MYHAENKYSHSICKIKATNHLPKKEIPTVNEPLEINTVCET